MKKILCMTLAMILALSLFACKNEEVPSEEAKPSEDVSAEDTQKEEKPAMGSAEIANPFYTFETMEEAEAVLDFTMTLPEVPSWASEVVYRPRTDGTMFEVIYFDDTDEIRMRKAPGIEDISGMYDEFADSSLVEVDGMEVTMKGEDKETMVMATWTDGTYSYFIRNTKGASKEEMAELVKAVK